MLEIKKLILILYLIYPNMSWAGEGYEAGRNWAERKGIDDPDDCRSRYKGKWEDDNINNSSSFTEGCLEYLRDENITDDFDELKDETSDEENEE